MKLETAQVRHVAKLARLALSAEEETQFGAQLSQVLEAVESLAAVDCTGVPPTVFAVNSVAHARPDEARNELSVTEALANAPQKVETSFAIPKVIE
ncbi:MAG: Asp-tRNA(Asn)/Glu-tRNA(Gln) amidotransferase subunit GatC [Archangium sp.]